MANSCWRLSTVNYFISNMDCAVVRIFCEQFYWIHRSTCSCGLKTSTSNKINAPPIYGGYWNRAQSTRSFIKWPIGASKNHNVRLISAMDVKHNLISCVAFRCCFHLALIWQLGHISHGNYNEQAITERLMSNVCEARIRTHIRAAAVVHTCGIVIELFLGFKIFLQRFNVFFIYFL